MFSPWPVIDLVSYHSNRYTVMDVEKEELIASSSSSSSPGNESKKSRGGNKFSMIWLVAITLTSLLWAAWSTFMLIDIGQGMDMQQSTLFYTKLQFMATSETNREHYENMAAIGTKGDYQCMLQGLFASCQNNESVIEIWFTPKGPMYKREKQTTNEHRMEQQTWPFGTTQLWF